LQSFEKQILKAPALQVTRNILFFDNNLQQADNKAPEISPRKTPKKYNRKCMKNSQKKK